jgi:hypothetical protein
MNRGLTEFQLSLTYRPLCLSVMVEILTLMGEFRKHIVLIGGWVPYFLLEEGRKEHTGSIDIDLALDFRTISDNTYRTILQLLKSRGFRHGKQPFTFEREVKTEAGIYTIEVDFLSGEYGGTTKSHRTQKVQDIRARKTRGCELAFEYNVPVKIKNRMPDGAVNEVEVKIAGIVPFLVMKGMALWESYKEKHAYDIYFAILHYPGGIDALLEVFNPLKSNNLIREGLGKIRAKFDAIDKPGPIWVVKFLEIDSLEEQERIQRDVFERVNTFLNGLQIESWQKD